MAKKLKRDLTMEEQLARGPLDLPFLTLVLLLTGIGVIMVFSASYPTAIQEGASPFSYFIRQGLFAVGGVVIMFAVSKVNYQRFRWMSVFVLIGSIVLLVLVLIPGIGVNRGGAQRWIRALGPIPSFQPSEVAKVGVIMYFAARLSKRNQRKPLQFNRRSYLYGPAAFLERTGFFELVPYGLILLLVAFLMLREPHMSGTILILVGGASVLFASGINLFWPLTVGGVGAVALAIIMFFTPYMKGRLDTWFNPWADVSDKGYQITQSLMTIGSGGLLGVGLGKGRQKFSFLPESENDFIFSVVCEELGLLGACGILPLVALLVFRGFWIAIHARDRFGALLTVGIVMLLAVQVFLNISVVTNFLPTTGISLPFFSYGGTALIIQLVEMGMVLSVSRQVPAPKQG